MKGLQLQSSSPPSSPLSMLSQSPSLPPTPIVLDASNRYPSPTSSSAPSGSASPMKSTDLSDSPGEIQVRTDGPPPAKRRRTAAPPPPRTTEYIDLESQGDKEDENLARLLNALRKRKRIVVIAGAGISVSSGVPDFRSATGLFSSLRGQHKLKASGKHLFDASVYKHDSSTTSFHTMVRELAAITANAKPSPFHHLLASLAQEGRLMRLYTQNIDNLDTQMPPLATNVPLNAKGPWPKTIQLHGGLEKMVCQKCSQLEPFNASLFTGPEPPPCQKCTEQDQVRTAFAGKRSHGIGRLRPRIVLYNEYNPDEEAIGNVSQADLRRGPDAVIVVGTTLKIPGVRRLVKELCQVTRSKRDGITAWINIEGEPQGAEFKDCWDLVVKGKCDDIAELVNLPRWDQQDLGARDSYMVTGDQQKEQRYEASLTRNTIEVPIEIKRTTTPESEPGTSRGDLETPAGRKSKISGDGQGGMPTPSASPRMRNSLPVSKPSKRDKAKQSTLQFPSGSSTQPMDTAPKATRVKLPTRGRPRKKELAKPQNTINQTFKATKAVASTGKDAGKKISTVDIVSSGTPSALPSLRPTNETSASAPKRKFEESPRDSSSAPAVNRIQQNITISPGSKPRSMDHLID
ncbi:DHS-like NAD/FAD-binding domain containing protein [Naviculisporaceae sp. PSN 640]